MDRIPDGVAVFLGSLSGRQNNELRYFSGAEVPRAFLVIDGMRRESIVFFTTRESYPRGENLSPDLATDPLTATGIEHYFAAEEFSSRLGDQLSTARVVCAPFESEVAEGEVSTENEWDGGLTRRRQIGDVLRYRFPGIEVKDCSETVWEQRRFKPPAEVQAIRQAGRIGASAMVEVMKAGRPGLHEYELSSLCESTCKRQGARELAFPTIISSA
jgi:Xaa-Pro aminopeptidase